MLVLGSLYKVSVDSPFFSAPPVVYVPAPLNALPAVGVGAPVLAAARGVALVHHHAAGVGEEGSSTFAGAGDASLLLGAPPATLLDPVLGEMPGPPEAGPVSIAAMPPSQAAAARGRGKEGVFKMLTEPWTLPPRSRRALPSSSRALARCRSPSRRRGPVSTTRA